MRLLIVHLNAADEEHLPEDPGCSGSTCAATWCLSLLFVSLPLTLLVCRLQLVSDRDKATRSAVLGALEAVYMQEGPSGFWDMLGRLNDQQKSLISERLKYTDKQVSHFAF